MNLITFVNSYAEHCKLNWKVTPNSKLPEVKFLSWKTRIIQTISIIGFSNTSKNDCENYDILFLVPPCLVEKVQMGKIDILKVKEIQ